MHLACYTVFFFDCLRGKLDCVMMSSQSYDNHVLLLFIYWRLTVATRVDAELWVGFGAQKVMNSDTM